MKKNMLTDYLRQYSQWLYESEKSHQTIKKYVHHLDSFFCFLGKKKLCKMQVLAWKEFLKKKQAPTSVNNALAALNGFFKFIGRKELLVHYIRIKKNVFCPAERELKREEYERLIKAAFKKKNERLAMILQTIGSTGIRISELKYITVEALLEGKVDVECKGRIRTVFFSGKLRRVLQAYIKKKHITSGMIFVTRNGKSVDRSNIWREMKNLGCVADVQKEKIFPHNLRHLFARCYYSQQKDLSRLADILGHSNINTTKVYTMESGETHLKQIEEMNLVFSEYNEILLML